MLIAVICVAASIVSRIVAGQSTLSEKPVITAPFTSPLMCRGAIYSTQCFSSRKKNSFLFSVKNETCGGKISTHSRNFDLLKIFEVTSPDLQKRVKEIFDPKGVLSG